MKVYAVKVGRNWVGQNESGEEFMPTRKGRAQFWANKKCAQTVEEDTQKDSTFDHLGEAKVVAFEATQID